MIRRIDLTMLPKNRIKLKRIDKKDMWLDVLSKKSKLSCKIGQLFPVIRPYLQSE
jgi:hypothetical protein